MFNYTIALKRLDKSIKASYRFSKNNSCVYDRSYYNYCMINSDANLIKELLNDVCFYKHVNSQIYTLTYDNILLDVNKKIIGPCNIMFINAT